VPGAIAGVVEPVLRKLDRKAVVGRLVQAGNKTIDQLPGQQLQVFKRANSGQVERGCG